MCSSRENVNPSREEKCDCTSVQPECCRQQLACRARGTRVKCGRCSAGYTDELRSEVCHGRVVTQDATEVKLGQPEAEPGMQ